MYFALTLLIPLTAGLGGYLLTRNFVRSRLRFVDRIQSSWAPWVAGVAAAALTSPVAFIPLLGSSAAAAFGIGVGLGTASGARAIRRGEIGSRHLIP